MDADPWTEKPPALCQSPARRAIRLDAREFPRIFIESRESGGNARATDVNISWRVLNKFLYWQPRATTAQRCLTSWIGTSAKRLPPPRKWGGLRWGSVR